MKRYRLTTADRNRIRAHAAPTLSLRELSEALELPRWSVENYVRREGLPFRGTTRAAAHLPRAAALLTVDLRGRCSAKVLPPGRCTLVQLDASTVLLLEDWKPLTAAQVATLAVRLRDAMAEVTS